MSTAMPEAVEPSAHQTNVAPRSRRIPTGQELAQRRLPFLASLPRDARVLMTFDEVALLLGVTAKTIRKRVKAGKLPPPDKRIGATSPRWWRTTRCSCVSRALGRNGMRYGCILCRKGPRLPTASI